MMNPFSLSVFAVKTTQPADFGTLAALVVFIVASMWIGWLANKAMQKSSFMKGFFLGNRGLGAWALALTATVQSGGTFMGFPSLVYSHGWVVALWICGYMVVPITGFGILGKRLAHLSRRTGAITVPDLFRSRFDSPMLGLLASLLIMFYMSFMMVAQFKAGAVVMKHSWPGAGSREMAEDIPAFRLTADARESLAGKGLPAEAVETLAALDDRGFDSEKDLRAELTKILSEDSVKQHGVAIVSAAEQLDWLYLIGLGVFTLTVVSYTLLGGFLAAVWTDLFQSVMMLVGVMLLLVLVLSATGGPEAATRVAVEKLGPSYAFGPGYDPTGVGRQFLPVSLAFSFFWVWVYSGVGSPAGMVRIMAGKGTEVIRKSIYLLAGYNLMIYLPLVMICVCGRALIDLPAGKTDSIIPELSIMTTAKLPGGSLIAGLILAAPFGAVMATVSSYLVVIASGLVRDVYQRFINPQAGTHDLRRLSYIAMIAVGVIAVLANIRPVAYLQVIVVFSGTGAAATFCIPAIMLAFWRRATVPGMIASMLGGAGTMVLLYILGSQGFGEQMIGAASAFRPYFFLGVDPLIWGLCVSLAAGVGVSLLTTPPSAETVSRLFDVERKPTEIPA
ncbi:MAG: sodium:solute symporter [Planctomycetaceae bacterium]|nr:MAG: sodium:solute symporter [Planctomycetaceae bacterium]